MNVNIEFLTNSDYVTQKTGSIPMSEKFLLLYESHKYFPHSRWRFSQKKRKLFTGAMKHSDVEDWRCYGNRHPRLCVDDRALSYISDRGLQATTSLNWVTSVKCFNLCRDSFHPSILHGRTVPATLFVIPRRHCAVVVVSFTQTKKVTYLFR